LNLITPSTDSGNSPAQTSNELVESFSQEPARLQQACTWLFANLAPNIAQQTELLRVQDILRTLKADLETRVAALLCPFWANAHEPIRAGLALSPGTVQLLEGHEIAKKVWPVYQARPQGSSAEGIRRLLLVLIKDVRVVLILLAEQLVLLRSLVKADDATRKQAAIVTADIHAPLANRLGVWQLKWELEDWAFRYSQPETYKKIATLLDERRNERETYIADFIDAISQGLVKAGLAAQVEGRPKHIWSIHKKMQKKGLAFSELYDVRAVRVMTADVPACYAALGVVHSLFQPIHNEFDDYIAHPKGNNYRSLHTAVLGPDSKAVEVQIRTPEMHEHAELGVAAHWRYKEGGASSAEFERKISWMRQLLDQRDGDDASLLAGFSTELLEDHVYLLTPKGEVMELPAGATVLDFAYYIHTRLGHTCRGAKVNSRIVPLTHQPKSGDQIDILRANVGEPNRNWLDSQQGYLRTPRARAKVRSYFNQLDTTQNLSAGRELFEKELKRVKLSEPPMDWLLSRYQLKKTEDLYLQIALGDLTMGQLARAINEYQSAKAAAAKSSLAAPIKSTSKLKEGVVKPFKPGKASNNQDAVRIDGVGNLLVTMANCCKPLPGDAISGFITRGRGLSVHRSDCKDIKHLAQIEPERLVEVQWSNSEGQRYNVLVRVSAFDRNGLLRDVGTIFAEAKVNILGSSTKTDSSEGTALMDYRLEVSDFGQLSQLLGKLRALPNVFDARRI
jgi:GTP pyrophosphokinase